MHRRAGSGFRTKDECEAAVAKLRLDTRERKFGLERPVPLKPTTIGEAIEDYLKVLIARWEAKHGQEYAERNSGQVNALRYWAEFAGLNRRVDSLNKDDLVYWMQHESKRGLQASSVARRINTIKAALNHAKETKADLINFRSPKRPTGKEANIQRMRILDENEIKSLSEVLSSNPEWQDAFDFFRVVLGGGGRFDEIVPVVIRKDKASSGIKWTDANKHFQTLRLFAHKTGRERILHVPAVVEVLLQRKAAKLGGETHVFTCRDHWMRGVFKKASESVGIPYGWRSEGGWTVHDLRHTCLTNLLQSGVDLATVRDFAGHHSISETTKYVHPTNRSRALAARASSTLVESATQSASHVMLNAEAKSAR